jgi:hypothetical protein
MNILALAKRAVDEKAEIDVAPPPLADSWTSASR